MKDSVRGTGSLWRPYEDEPLFVPEMLLGFDALASSDSHRLTDYLLALVGQRGTVHTTVAFNAVYFGYDLSFGGYVGGPVDFDSFPGLTFGRPANRLPTGAMVSVTTGTDPLYAEIVHTEEDRTGDARFEPHGVVNGGPNDTDSPRTRLLCDMDAFSPGTVVTHARLDRLRSHGRWIDADGHLLQENGSGQAEGVGEDDLSRFVEYLLGPGLPQLMAGPLPLILADGVGPEGIGEAVLAALRTVETALARIEGVRVWRGYAFTQQSLAARLRDEGPLGGADMELLVAKALRPIRDRNGETGPRRTAVGPFLRGLSGVGPLLAGTGYLNAVVHANTLIDDHLAAHCIDDVLPTGVRVRLEHPRRDGGTWCAEPADSRRLDDRGVTPVTPTAPARPRAASRPAVRLVRGAVEYEVPPFLRRLPRGQQASDVARSEYHRLLARFGILAELPTGFTLVRGHSRTRGGR